MERSCCGSHFHYRPPCRHPCSNPNPRQLDEKCLKAQHNISQPPPYFLWLPLLHLLTEFLLQQKTTNKAIIADTSSSLSCPVQTNKDRGSCWTALWWWDTGSLLSASAGLQDAAESRSYIIFHSMWQPVMESLLMFNHRQELMQLLPGNPHHHTHIHKYTSREGM